MKTLSFQSVRFSGDQELLEQLRGDELVAPALQRTEILRRRSVTRMRLLSQAVRVNVRLLPNVAASFAHLAQHLSSNKPLEAYVFSEPGINAFVAEGVSHILVGVSSGAVSTLSSEELKFVIGHELGHASFGHLEVVPEMLLEVAELDLRRCQMIRAWQRAAEVSADRAGLVCCGSLEVAATALFKTVSGLNMPGLQVEPLEFAQQWEHLVNEVLDDGRRDQWQLSHPFPPLRMKALMAFVQQGPGSAADTEARRLLALMDGSSSAQKKDVGDPLLSRFVFWGGAYVALAGGQLSNEARTLLHQVAPEGVGLEEVLQAPDAVSQVALQRFQEARRNRRSKLTSSELHSIATGLIDMVRREGSVSSGEMMRLRYLGEELGIAAKAMDMMVAKRLKEG
jgi:Zn-dependent protease with chaperone function